MAFGFVTESRFERDLPEPECNSNGFEIIMYKIFIRDKDIMSKPERVKDDDVFVFTLCPLSLHCQHRGELGAPPLTLAG